MKHVWTAVRIAVTIAIFAYLLKGIDLDAAIAALRRLTWPWIALTLALIAIDRWLMCWRWTLLIRATTPMPPAGLVRIFFVSSFLGSFLPAGIGGDAARAFQVGRHTGNAGPALASVVVDRWLGLITVGIAGCAGVLASITLVPDALRGITIVMTIAIAVAGIATLYADRIAGRLVPALGMDGYAGRSVHRLASALAAYRRHPGVLWKVAALSMVVQAVRISIAWAIGQGLGIGLPFSYYWVFMPLNILIILLPLSLGGFGLPQGAMVWTLGPFGVGATEAFLLSLLFVLSGVISNIPGAVLYLMGRSSDG